MNTKTYTIDSIIDMQKKITRSNCMQIWEQFVKWAFFQFQSERHISFGQIGDYGYKIDEQSNKKIPFLFFNQAFLKKYNIVPKIHTFLLKPIVKINYSAVYKHLYMLVKQQDIKQFIDFLIQMIQKIVKTNYQENQIVIIDLDIMGHIIKKNNQTWFEYVISPQKDKFKNTGLRFHLKKQQQKIGSVPLSKIGLLTSRQGMFPKIQRKPTTSQNQKQIIIKNQQLVSNNIYQNPVIKSSTKRISLTKLKTLEKQSSHSQNRALRSQSLKQLGRTKMNSFYKPPKHNASSAIGQQMMGAGTDPLKKDQNFSRLTTDLKSLMETKFSYPKVEENRHIPIIDSFSRTLACPIATQRQNPLVAARIGCHLSLKSQALNLLASGIVFFKQNQTILTSKNQMKKQNIITEQEEYQYINKKQKSQLQMHLLNLRKQNFGKYIKLFEMIASKHIQPINQEIIAKILGHINEKYENFEIIDKILQEVISSYEYSIKKSIIDYILLDPIEQNRVSVYIKYKPISHYGKTIAHQHTWSHQLNLKKRKQRLEYFLLKNSEHVLNIERLWNQEYMDQKLLTFPISQTQYFTIDEFCDKQRLAIKKIRAKIINQWVPKVSEIYKLQISDLKRHQQKCQVFFESTSTLLHNQIRNFVSKFLEQFNNFFQIFNLADLNPPQTVVHLQKTLSYFQHSFVSVRLSHRRQQIYFMDNLDEIGPKIIQIVNALRQISLNIPRPQNLITKTEKLFQMSITQSDHIYLKIRNNISEIVKKNVENTKKCLQIFQRYSYLLSQPKRVQKWIQDQNHDRRQYSLTLSKYKNLYEEVLQNLPFFIRINMINVDASQLKRFYLKIVDQIIMKVQKSVYDLVMKKNQQIQNDLLKMMAVASTTAHTCQKLVEIQNSIDFYRRVQIKKLHQKHADLVKWISITLYSTFYPVNEQDLDILFQTTNFLKQINQKLNNEETHLEEERQTLQKDVRFEAENIKNKISVLLTQIHQLKQFGSNLLTDSALQLLQKCRTKINEYKVIKKQLNKKELLLGMDESQLQKLIQWDKNLVPFEDLWKLVKKYASYSQSWTRQNIFKQNSDFIQGQTKVMLKAFLSLSNNQIIKKVAPNTIKVAEQMTQQIKQFQLKIPIITVFSNPGLKDRHFKNIAKLIDYQGDNLNASSNLFLGKVLGMGVGKHINELEAISQVASKQYMIENVLTKIQNEWKQVKFQMKNYKDTEMKILTGASIQQIQAYLDDHSLKVLTIKGSVYAKIFEQQIERLQEWLNYTSSMIDLSTKVQAAWMYLEPVMTSPDILKHLSVQGSKFMVVDQNWKKIIHIYSQAVLINQITKNRKIVKSLKECMTHLQVVQKGLNSYLQSKRLSFPRFFFLSNEELLEILSETKDPKKVQPHLKKCFQGIFRLQFQEQRYIIGMYSSQGEYVPFSSKVNTSLARGNVDQWLSEVQERMTANVRRQISDSHADYTETDRKKCLLNRCAMSILTVQMTNWTKFVQQSLIQKTVRQSTIQTQKWLQEVVELIKDSELEQIHKMTLQALIVLSVHNLDITKNLQSQSIQTISDFQWQSQLRYYFKYNQQFNDERTQVKILNTTCSFNHEYLGNTSRLVITPLTDRCYRTLCSAIYLNYGGAPQGPAGTGKTQTVKDLAKALACQCVVFNCSDGLDYKAMSKFFKGLATSGAWSCFDQFNRINLQVLSVVAQQILCIQRAKAAGQNVFIFEDTELRLKKTANTFITMNPGYAGRSQLPDNLKTLFRSVAMMIPDYAMIAQISLYSYGFEDARNLARKIVTTYKLCSQQLSSQSHYDYGMRAVKSVLVAAGSLRRKQKQMSQSALILKAINDINLAKFLAFDIPLFKGITSDLFPQIQCPQANYNSLVQHVKIQFETRNLSLNEYSLQKIIQIYDMILVRHGVMIVGYPFSGKTTNLEILAQCLGRCSESLNENQVDICKINPKSITMQQLYGSFDLISHEWFDGVLPVKFRNFASAIDTKRKWLVFDGPVDALWIENMNTVLDDNKKLCLNSGQIIAMSKSMSMLFQSMDLLAASPATVSRCGMIYLQPNSLGYNVLIQSWYKKNSNFRPQVLSYLKEFTCYIENIYKQIQNLDVICQISIFSLIKTLFIIIDKHFDDLFILKQMLNQQNSDQNIVQNLEQKQVYNFVGGIFFFAILWSFGAALDTKSKKPFDIYLKRLVLTQFSRSKTKKISFPDKGTLFEYQFKYQQIDRRISTSWIKWSDDSDDQTALKKLPIYQIIVKTNDIIRYNYFLKLYFEKSIPVILCGPTGTGKTVLVKGIYKQKFNHQQTGLLQIVFSSKTTCSQVQQQVESKLDKRGSKLIIGPKTTKNIIMYIDDLNMPTKQVYGAQPPIQLLRQILDQGGVYQLKQKQKFFKQIIDLSYVYCMSSVNNKITQRFLRHTNLISVANFDEDTLNHIFSTILNISFHNHSQQKNIKVLLKNCIEIYEECLKRLLPTPTKLHYSFNLRDLWKLVIGICLADKQKIHSQNIGRLWGHQAKRIFKDRLLPHEKHIAQEMIINIGKKWGKNMNTVYFSDILSIGLAQKSYQQIYDIQKVNLAISTFLNNYNAASQKPMDLVLFQYALQHILIVLRIIKQPKGHAFLIGMGGSGRKSFATLAAFIADYIPFNLQITKNYSFIQFRQDIKKIFIDIGAKNKQTVWIFNDGQIKQQQFLQDINNILNLGIVPNIFLPQQRIEICEIVRKEAVQYLGSQISLDKIFEYFIQKIKNRLRLILCFSPIGQSFRKRLRMFPSLINCTTIDWYEQWPTQGLISVANKFLSKVQIKNKQMFINLIQYLHSNSKKWSLKYKQQMKRIFYVTPNSYIEFINSFKTLLVKKRKQIKQNIYKYENGYHKIIQTQKTVEIMKKNLEEMKPKIRKAAQDTAVKMEMVKIKKAEADFIMEQVSTEEKIVLQAVTQANFIKDDCEKQLAIAMPMLKAAQNALLVLDKNHLTQLKTMMNPPPAVRLVMQGLCLLIDPNPKQKIKNEKTFKMETDWWAASIRNLANPKLLNDLVGFNKQGLAQNIVVNLGNFLNQPGNKEILSIQNVAKSSKACECIIQWINGIYNFYFVNKKIKPKKQSLKIAEEKMQVLNKKLQQKRKQLNDANKTVEQLNYQLEWAQKTKEKLQVQYKECEVSLYRANVIISNLGNEKIRWLDLSQQFKKKQEKIDASVLIASAQISYLGPFTQFYRDKIVQEWKDSFATHKVDIGSNTNLISILGRPLTIREWNMNGLPSDNFSIQNAIIMYNSRRWPLMIDPQQQATKWLKKQQIARKIKVIKMTQDNFIRNLENCIQFGTPVLIQNLGQQINVALNPILLKQTYKKGSTTYLKMGQNVLIYSNDFFLYMASKHRNPHYLPEISTQVALINFMITEQGLTNQLLSLLVSKQRPQLEQEKIKLVVEFAQNQKTLMQIQQKILDILNHSQNILADQTAINVLTASKETAIQISEKEILSKQTEKLIDQTRSQYKPAAIQGSTLFFTVVDLGGIDIMYQYSLTYFSNLFQVAISKSQKSFDVHERISNLKQTFKLSLFQNISRSLFQKDRLLFSTLIALRLEKFQSQNLRFLLTSSISLKGNDAIQKPNIQWMTDKIWQQLKRLSKIQNFQRLLSTFFDQKKIQIYQTIIKSHHPLLQQLPQEFQVFSFKDKLLIFKCLRPDKMIEGFTLLVKNTLNQDFVRSLPFDLSNIFPDSNSKIPLLYILSAGSDPFVSISNFSKVKNMSLQSISLGQGQGPIAERIIKQNLQKGGWVVLQNCHLATSWLGNLQKIIQSFEDEEKQIHQNFRIWLTSYPNNQFPQSIIQKSLKMTNQPPKGLKNNLLVSYLSDPLNDQQFFNGSLYSQPFKKLLYSLCFFHALIQQRRKFGPLGWNVSYEFTQSDLRISSKQLKLYIDDMRSQSEIPFDALKYLIGQCNYGGRVTDANDRRLLAILLQSFFNKNVINQKDYNFGNSKQFILKPQVQEYEEYITYINTLPQFGSPVLVGLHENADITRDINQSNSISSSLLLCSSSQNSSKGSGKSQQQQVVEIALNIINQETFPTKFNLIETLQKHPVLYQQSMNTVLNQQLGRYNGLLQIIKCSLEDLIKAIKGEIIMTNDLQNLFKSLYEGKIPDLWKTKSYPSFKSLSSYILDLLQRVQFFKKWVKDGIPSEYWISGFFFTQSFLTGVLQNYSRRNKIAVDELSFEFLFSQQIRNASQGANIYGLYIQGARWNNQLKSLQQSRPRELFVHAPHIYLKPQITASISAENVYETPVYKTLQRRGVLSTTGHSTNFVMMIKTPTNIDQKHWIKRGVAYITQLNN